jgi:ABC-type amino acid transport substrate-binding protein
VRIVRLAAGAVLGLGLAAAAGAAGPVKLFVLREHGVTTVALAQPYLDRFVALAAAHNGWSSAQGVYLMSRANAEQYVKDQQPQYAILSAAAFLALQNQHELEVLGKVTSSLAGGRSYHLISRQAKDVAGCKGKTLATDHGGDARFLERVVAKSAWKLADFQVEKTRRPLQTTRMVLDGKAVCALIDDAQLADLKHLPNTADVRTLWSSQDLPQMLAVAFPSVKPEERKAFRASLPLMCKDEGQAICAEVGIVSIEPAENKDFTSVIAAYGE